VYRLRVTQPDGTEVVHYGVQYILDELKASGMLDDVIDGETEISYRLEDTRDYKPKHAEEEL